MNLTYDERILLAIYLEFFNRCYDLDDKRKYEEGSEILVRHVEMQNIYYLLESLWISFQYGFTWNWKGPYSSGLQATLNELDKKKLDIEKFYTEYNDTRNSYYNNRYSDQLSDILSNYLDERNIRKLALASFVLEDVLNQEQGSEILAGIIYIGKTVYPGQNLSIILPELNERGYNPSPELAEAIWKDLAILDIRDMDTKSFTRERKLVNKHNGRIQ